MSFAANLSSLVSTPRFCAALASTLLVLVSVAISGYGCLDILRHRRHVIANDIDHGARLWLWMQLRIKVLVAFVQIQWLLPSIDALTHLEHARWAGMIVRGTSAVTLTIAILLNSRDRRRLAESAESENAPPP